MNWRVSRYRNNCWLICIIAWAGAETIDGEEKARADQSESERLETAPVGIE